MKTIVSTCGEKILVSDRDYPFLSKFSWRVMHPGHKQKAATRIKTAQGWRWKYMHRMITRAPRQKQVDHKKGNGLDNRRSSLRTCSQSQNLRGFRRPKSNKFHSQFRGVTFCKRQNKWLAQIRFHLGYFSDEKLAARAYDKAAKRLYGKFATPNF